MFFHRGCPRVFVAIKGMVRIGIWQACRAAGAAFPDGASEERCRLTHRRRGHGREKRSSLFIPQNQPTPSMLEMHLTLEGAST